MMKCSAILLAGILMLWLCFLLYKKTKDLPSITLNNQPSDSPNAIDNSVKIYAAKALQLKAFAEKHKMNTSVCFLINMKLPSNLFRFYVYDFNNNKVLYKGRAANGKYIDDNYTQVKFSNEPESGCTSLGRYKIGYKYIGNYGNAYKLYGLDTSNSNAFNRNIVLHSFKYIPDKESDVLTSLSSGCPMVSPRFLDTLSSIIDTAHSSIVMEIFNE